MTRIAPLALTFCLFAPCLVGCTHMARPAVSELHGRVVANRETYECADYMGCPGGLSVRWCEHSEGGYDGSTHGWPTFGGDAVWEFVQSL